MEPYTLARLGLREKSSGSCFKALVLQTRAILIAFITLTRESFIRTALVTMLPMSYAYVTRFCIIVLAITTM
jgi:hypothetical protein